MAKSNVIRIEDYRTPFGKTDGYSPASKDADALCAKIHETDGDLQESNPSRIKNDSIYELVDVFSEEASDELGKVQNASFKEALLFLQNFPFEDFPKPMVLREPDGCISLDWERGEYPGSNFSISLSGKGTVYFAGMFHGGDECHGKGFFDGYNIPMSIILNLRLLYEKF